MASTTAQIRVALAAAVTTGLGSTWQVSAYMLAAPVPPAVDIRPAGIDYDVAMSRGGDDLTYMVRAMAAFNADGIGAQLALDTLLDTTAAGGMKAILETDKTLGGVVSDLRVTTASDYKALIVEGQPPLLAVEFTVEVLTP